MRKPHNENSGDSAGSYGASKPSDFATHSVQGDNSRGHYSANDIKNHSANAGAPSCASNESTDSQPARPSDRRVRSRVKISAPVRVRPVNSTGDAASEVTSTLDVSRNGIRFTSSAVYQRGDKVAIVFPYGNVPGEVYAEQMAHVVRTIECPDGSTQVAISFDSHAELPEEISRQLLARNEQSARPSMPLPSVPQKEYASAGVLVVEPDERARQTICSYLVNEGYKVVGVGSHDSAREILSTHVPALVIAEIEGEGMPGLDLCAHIKSERRLNRVPVILITRSAYPSDYANAHRAGAIICMAKPFKQEKLGHMVRLLAPLKRNETKIEPAVRAGSSRVVASPPRAALPASRPSSLPAAKKPAVPQPRPQQAVTKSAANENSFHAEFKDLCNEAINEKSGRDSGRYDMAAVPEPVVIQKKSGLSLKSLFKR